MKNTKCNSCKNEMIEGVRFPCPKCNHELLRCNKCKQLSIVYECSCGCQGP